MKEVLDPKIEEAFDLQVNAELFCSYRYRSTAAYNEDSQATA